MYLSRSCLGKSLSNHRSRDRSSGEKASSLRYLETPHYVDNAYEVMVDYRIALDHRKEMPSKVYSF